MTTYRTMALSDYNSIIALWKNAEGVKMRDADSMEGIAKYLLRNPNLSFIAEVDGILVGTIMAGHDGKRGYIQHLAVSNHHRKQGIATKLISLCLFALKSEGILKSHIHVLSNNTSAKSYWINRGWQKRDDIDVYSFINSDNLNI